MLETRIRKRRPSKRNGRVERLMARVRKRRQKQIAWLLIFAGDDVPERGEGRQKKNTR